MEKKDQQLKKEILELVEDSNMKFNRKMKLLSLLDKAFRKHLGIIYLSDREIENKDILNRSM